MVERVSGERQTPALDRVREQHRGPVGVAVGLVERLDDLVEVVPTEVGEQPREIGVGHSSRQRASASRWSAGASAVRKPRTSLPDRRISAGTPRSTSRRCGPQDVAARAGEDGLQPPSVLALEHLPAGSLEDALEPSDAQVGTTRSRLWRLRSTMIVTLPSPASASSTTASQMLPSSSSASPMTATNRAVRLSARLAVREGRSGRPGAAKSGATAPSPTDPVEKSTGSGSFVRLG